MSERVARSAAEPSGYPASESVASRQQTTCAASDSLPESVLHQIEAGVAVTEDPARITRPQS